MSSETASTISRPDEGLSRDRADLLETLGQARYFLRFTVRGLTDEQSGLRTTPSALCLGGLIKHVARGERAWADFIRGVPSSVDEGDVKGHVNSFLMLPGETLAQILEEYDEIARATDELVASLADLDETHPLPKAPWFPPNAVWSNRRAILHIAAETTQHAGHADIIREALDGARTMG